jgi:glycosyltransferase involved in cell wall biosynthesis
MPYLQTARAAHSRRVGVVVSTHGMLHARALDQRSWAKRIARWLFQDALLLDSSRCLHATAAQEAEEIRRAGYRGPIAVIPWGIDIPDLPARRGTPYPPVLLYVGRLHPSKGLEALLAAWARVQTRFETWQLVIAGPDEDGYRAVLERRARELRVVDRVVFAGPVGGDDREALFASASIVVLPSPAENFGLVVAEALARNVPAIATTGAPWRLLEDERCGWWTGSSVDAIAAALVDALGADSDVRREMGERGRSLAASRFAWSRITAQMTALYQWVAGGGDTPQFVLS